MPRKSGVRLRLATESIDSAADPVAAAANGVEFVNRQFATSLFKSSFKGSARC
jgi:hypothetical protein